MDVSLFKLKKKNLTVLGVSREDNSARSCGYQRKGIWELDLPASPCWGNLLHLCCQLTLPRLAHLSSSADF